MTIRDDCRNAGVPEDKLDSAVIVWWCGWGFFGIIMWVVIYKIILAIF